MRDIEISCNAGRPVTQNPARLCKSVARALGSLFVDNLARYQRMEQPQLTKRCSEHVISEFRLSLFVFRDKQSDVIEAVVDSQKRERTFE